MPRACYAWCNGRCLNSTCHLPHPVSARALRAEWARGCPYGSYCDESPCLYRHPGPGGLDRDRLEDANRVRALHVATMEHVMLAEAVASIRKCKSTCGRAVY